MRVPTTVSAQASSFRLQINCASSWVDNHLGLMQWIEQARKLLAEIQAAADGDPQLRDRLKAHDIRYNHFCEGRESAGIFQLTEDVAQAVHGIVESAKDFADEVVSHE